MEQTKYELACIKCGTMTGLRMVAHRNADGCMVGWVFVCESHQELLVGHDVFIQPRQEFECEAGIHGGCGACKVCDPEWWKKLKAKQDEQDDGDPGCPNCDHGYRPKPIVVEFDMERLVRWRDGLCDDCGDGLHRVIARKLRLEDPDPAPENKARVPEELRAALRRFQAMDEDTQCRVCFAVLGE